MRDILKPDTVTLVALEGCPAAVEDLAAVLAHDVRLRLARAWVQPLGDVGDVRYDRRPWWARLPDNDHA